MIAQFLRGAVKDSDKFLPDLDLIDTGSLAIAGYDGPDGLLVCKVGARAIGLQEGDVITHAGGLPLALDKEAMRALKDAEDFGELSPERLREWGRQVAARFGEKRVENAADKLAKELEARDEELAVAEEVLARLNSELEQALEGKYAESVDLTVWRPDALDGGGGTAGYRPRVRLPSAITCRRVRDRSKRAPSHTPERCAVAAVPLVTTPLVLSISGVFEHFCSVLSR